MAEVTRVEVEAIRAELRVWDSTRFPKNGIERELAAAMHRLLAYIDQLGEPLPIIEEVSPREVIERMQRDRQAGSADATKFAPEVYTLRRRVDSLEKRAEVQREKIERLEKLQAEQGRALGQTDASLVDVRELRDEVSRLTVRENELTARMDRIFKALADTDSNVARIIDRLREI